MPGRLNREEPPPQPLSQPPQAEMDRTTSTEDIPGQPDMVPSPISGFSPAHDDNGTTDTENNDKETNLNTTSMEDIPGQPGEIERNNNATNLPGGEERDQQQPPQTPPSTPAGIDLGQGESGNPTIIDFEPNDN